MKWEYKLIRIYDIDMVEDVMDGYGHLGWEAISINEHSGGLRVYCKRPIGWVG